MSNAHWHFVSDEARKLLGGAPESLFASAVAVKRNCSRCVLKVSGLYLKLDRRFFHSFKREIEISRLLDDAGFPTADILAYGKINGSHAMISREVPNAVAFDAYLRSQPPSRAMLNALTELVCKWIASDFIHRDFHAGNLLCIPAENRFVLIDLHAVSCKHFWQRRPDYEAARLLLSPRRWLRENEMVKLLADAGVPDPTSFYQYALQKEARILLGEWHKRRKQILHGYPKFTRVENDRLIAVHTSPIKLPERQINGRAYFLAHILLDIAEIPHRQVAEFDLLTREALLFPRPSSMHQPPPALCEEMMARLSLYGIQSRKQDWSMLPGSPLPVLINLSPVAAAIERWEKAGV